MLSVIYINASAMSTSLIFRLFVIVFKVNLLGALFPDFAMKEDTYLSE